ncbi:TPA: hypothetical protein ACMU2U_001446 [Clostridioides difficile]|nr:hypothetical protein [Clostridioides difficile]MCI4304708.1 hypothetical protein [Clostridioides difficile]MCM4101605.1 hypothetical protein [Clostridioides difficile]
MSNTSLLHSTLWMIITFVIGFTCIDIIARSWYGMSIIHNIIIVIITIAIAFVIEIYTCEEPNSNPDFDLENKIVENIELNGSIDLNKLADFEFRKMYICSPEAPMEQILEDGVFTISHRPFNNDNNYLIFVNEENEVVKFTGLNKKYKILNSTFKEYSRKDAVFKFKKLEYQDRTIYEVDYSIKK